VRERLAKQPSNDLRCGLAVLLLRMGRDEEAMRELRAVLEDEPASYLGHLDLGTALALGGDLEAALEHMQRALTLSGKPSPQPGGSLELIATALAEKASRGD
jgi:tetratricopeptide (TPR) repeat protein